MDSRLKDLALISSAVKGRQVVLLDFPMYRNLGDLLIHAGTEEFFSSRDYAVAGRYCSKDLGGMDCAGRFRLSHRISEVDRLVGDGASIVFQGGGNFGDLWPHHQRLREAAVRRYSGVSITVLPQTAWFSNDQGKREAERAFATAGDIHVFCRDARSLQLLKDFVPCSLAPDMAHQLWGGLVPRPARKRETKIVQSRDDAERVGDRPKGAFDWTDLLGRADGLAWRILLASRRAPAHPLTKPLGDILWRALANRWMRLAAGKFDSAYAIETDRLHGMILASLLSMPVHFKENSYGKLRSYFQLWLADSPLVRPVGAA